MDNSLLNPVEEIRDHVILEFTLPVLLILPLVLQIPLQIDTTGFLKTTKPVILNLVPREDQKTGK